MKFYLVSDAIVIEAIKCKLVVETNDPYVVDIGQDYTEICCLVNPRNQEVFNVDYVIVDKRGVTPQLVNSGL